jgi:hypothetical protein
MGKKGALLVMDWLIDLFFLAVVLIAMLAFVHASGSQTSFERQYIAKDIALLANAIYASPNNIMYFYSENDFPYTISFTPGIVKVAESGSLLTAKDGYFIEDEKIEMMHKLINPVKIRDGEGNEKTIIALGFSKSDTRIELFTATRTGDIP